VKYKNLKTKFKNHYQNKLKTFPLLLPKKEVFLQKDKNKNK